MAEETHTPEEWDAFWKWANPDTVIDQTPIGKVAPPEPDLTDMLPTVEDIQSAFLDAMDPFGALRKTTEATESTIKAIHDAAVQSGKSFGQIIGISVVVLGGLYLLTKVRRA